MPFALMRFMTPWIEEERKLSEPAFMTRRKIPTRFGSLADLCDAENMLVNNMAPELLLR